MTNSSISNFYTAFANVFGAYSIEKHLALALGLIAIHVVLITLLAVLRGQGALVIKRCLADFGFGIICVLTFVLLPASFYFFWRSIWRAATLRDEP